MTLAPHSALRSLALDGPGAISRARSRPCEWRGVSDFQTDRIGSKSCFIAELLLWEQKVPSAGSIDRKVVRFVGPAVRVDFRNLPPDVYEAATDVLRLLQSGELPKGRDVYTRLKEGLTRIDEIRIDGPDGNTYRIYDIIRFREAISARWESKKSTPPKAATSERPTRGRCWRGRKRRGRLQGQRSQVQAGL